jgi:hypothetical protein
MNACQGSRCLNGTTAIISLINVDDALPQCDILKILYESNPIGDFWYGNLDQVTSKSAYLVTLINMGFTVSSAFLTLETGNVAAWTEIKDKYGS